LSSSSRINPQGSEPLGEEVPDGRGKIAGAAEGGVREGVVLGRLSGAAGGVGVSSVPVARRMPGEEPAREVPSVVDPGGGSRRATGGGRIIVGSW